MTKSKHHELSATQARSVPEMREDFRAYDRDSDGRINFLEFREFVTSLDENISDEEVMVGFRDLDSDRDGSISFQEFLTWWNAA